MKKSYYAILAACLLLGLSSHAQTAVENLQSAVEIYNAMREYEDGLNSKSVTQSNIDDMQARMDKGIPLLDKVIREGNAEQIKVARYFRNNFKYELSFVYGMKGENYKAYDAMKEIERDVTAFAEGDFPLHYEYFGKNYAIKWENFAPTQAEFLTGFAEVCYNLSKYEEAMRMNKKAIAHPYVTDWLRYISANKMLDIYEKDNSLLTQEEQINYAVQAILEYDKLSEDSKVTVKENNYPTVKRSAAILVASASNSPSSTTIGRCGEAAPIVVKYDPDNPNAIRLYELCYKNNYSSSAAWDKVAYDFANLSYTKLQMAQPVNMVATKQARYVGLAATDHIAANTSLVDCEALKAVADRYSQWNQADKAAEYLKKSKSCTENREKEAARQAKIERRARGNFNLYLGADIFPLLNTNPKRDYGAVVDFVFRKSAIEFGYKKIRQNKENIFDLVLNEVDDADQDNVSRWDGMKLHFEPKFFTKNSDNGYMGIRLGYTEKSFDSIYVNVVNDLDGAYSNQLFKPNVKQYLGMLTFGGMLLGKGVGLDFKGGIGVNYSTFESGNPLDRSQNTIENPLLEHRKDHYWTPVLYMGMTMGLNFGPGRS
jgi:hypothetical protein